MTWEELLKAANGSFSDGSAVRRKPRHTEDNLQIQCMRWLQYQYPRLYDLTIHIPNGGARSKVEGSIFKAIGVKAGFPDLFMFYPVFCDSGSLPTGEGGGRGYHGLAIEMKTTDKSSRQRDTQKQWQARLQNEGYQYHIARTLEEFQQIITNYIKPLQQQ